MRTSFKLIEETTNSKIKNKLPVKLIKPEKSISILLINVSATKTAFFSVSPRKVMSEHFNSSKSSCPSYFKSIRLKTFASHT